MADNEAIITPVGFEYDKRSADEIRRGLQQVGNQYNELGKRLQATNRALADTSAIEKQQKAVRALREEITETKKASKGGFDIGKVGGTLGLARGGLGALGLGGPVTDLLEAAEGVADLAESAQGLSGIIPGLSGGFGSMLSVALPLAAAFLAVAAAMEIVNQQNAEIRAEFERQIDISRRVSDEIAEGTLTQERASKRIDVLNKKSESEQERLELLEKSYQEFEQSTGVLSPLFKVLSADEQSLADQIDVSRKRIAEFNSEQEVLQKAIESGDLASTDAAKAEADLASTRQSGITATMQASQAEVEAKRQQEAAARESAQKQQEIQRTQEQAAQKAADALRNYNTALRDIAKNAGRAIADARREATRAQAALEREFQDTLSEQTIENNRATLEAQINAFRDEERAYREHQDSLRDIQRDFDRQREDALRTRDVFALEQANREQQRAQEDVEDQFDIEARERAIQQNEAATDQMRHFQELRDDTRRNYELQRRDAQIQLRQTLQDIRTDAARQRADARQAKNQELADARAAQMQSLKMQGEYWNHFLKQQQSALSQASKLGAGALRSSGRLNAGQLGANVQNQLGRLQSQVQSQISNQFTFNGANIQQIMGVLKSSGIAR